MLIPPPKKNILDLLIVVNLSHGLSVRFYSRSLASLQDCSAKHQRGIHVLSSQTGPSSQLHLITYLQQTCTILEKSNDLHFATTGVLFLKRILNQSLVEEHWTSLATLAQFLIALNDRTTIWGKIKNSNKRSVLIFRSTSTLTSPLRSKILTERPSVPPASNTCSNQRYSQ